MSTSPRHVIFGTGAIGLATLDALRRRGETRAAGQPLRHRPGPRRRRDRQGDASDPGFTTAAAAGAQVVYQTLAPPYHQWVELFPALQAGVLAAAQAIGARLVSMENVYMYGRPAGQPLTETRPYAAHTKKGQLRARMAGELLAAHQAGRVQVAIGRASDYFGPRGGALSNLGDRVFPAALAGKTATVWATPTSRTPTPTSPTSAKASPSSANTPTPPARSGTCPTTPTPGPPASWSTASTGQAGQPRTKLRGTPALLLRALGVVNPTVRELVELQYEFQEPFIVDSSKIATKLNVHATPLEQALADTLASYRTNPSLVAAAAAPEGLRNPLERARLRMKRAPTWMHRMGRRRAVCLRFGSARPRPFRPARPR